jgi:hypothetical protein
MSEAVAKAAAPALGDELPFVPAQHKSRVPVTRKAPSDLGKTLMGTLSVYKYQPDMNELRRIMQLGEQ